jgi:hypothetical protein
VIEEANEALRAKGYSEANLAAVAAFEGRALLKGNKLVSPFSDSAATVLAIARDLVPTLEALGKRRLTPTEFRTWLEERP